MTDQRDLDRIMGAFLATGTDELPDRALDAALDRIAHTPQRRAMVLRRRTRDLPVPARVAAAAAVCVIAVGAVLYLARPGGPAFIGGPEPTPSASTVASAPAVAPTPTPAASPSPTPVPTVSASMTDMRQIHTATLLGDGRVLVAAGYGSGQVSLDSADLFDPKAGGFVQTGSLATARGLHTATVLADGRVLITGGGVASWMVSGATYLASAEVHDPRTGTFSPTGSMGTTREDHTATLLSDGRVLIAGGNDMGDHSVASAELYDPRTGTFSPTGSMATARGFHTATLLPDGRVLIAGGDAAAWTDPGPFIASAELYDPRTGTFTKTGPMTVGRAHHTATLLSDGRVLITGGAPGFGTVSLASAEIYDPKTGRFTATGAMTAGRIYQTATLLSDGRVLIAGGNPRGMDYANAPVLASAEIYDPRTATFIATGSMTVGRTYQTATLLRDGRVLVAGGYGDFAGLVPLASAEIYDPKTGTFRAVSPGA